MKRVEFRPDAEEELQDAFDWYEEQEHGLGTRFAVAVDGMIDEIVRRPTSFPALENRRFRRAFLDKFPFAIVYSEEVNTLIIASVFHTSRNPIILQDRID